jgi:flagellar protein FlaG
MAIPIQNSLPLGSGQSLVTINRPAVNATGTPAEPADLPQSVAHPLPLHEAVAAINRKLEETSQNLRFSVDDGTGKLVVKVVDTATDQVIRQIPSEVAIAISRSLERLQGLLVRQQA